MIQAVLFDLDDTLLGNDMGAFVPRYFELLGRYAAKTIDPRRLHEGLMRGTRAMFENEDLSRTNAEVFWEAFTAHTGVPRAEGEPFFEIFYRTVFPQLEKVTQRRPEAAKMVGLCAERGWPVVIATNPVFPRIAIEERLRWAGIPATEHAYALVTCYENMHSTKPRMAYFEEILERLDVEPSAVLMAGNDLHQDIAPAKACRMQTFTVVNGSAGFSLFGGPRGTLAELLDWLSGK